MSTNAIDRRAFLVGAAAGIAHAGAQSGRSPSASPPRRTYELCRNWRFLPRVGDEALEPRFDDSKSEIITLPHTNVRLPWHSFDDRAYQFISVYRRHFRAPSAWRGKRVFADFDGAMTASTVAINGTAFPEYKGGYTPFSVELTDHLRLDADNLLAVKLDSTERADIPPFGGKIDYLTFGGIYRDVRLRVVPKTYIVNVFARPVRVQEPEQGLEIRCWLDGPVPPGAKLAVALKDGTRVLATKDTPVENSVVDFHELAIDRVGDIQLWDLEHPKLYQVHVILSTPDGSRDEYSTTVGFRNAKFTPAGFMLNGRHIKLRGLDRHQTFPFVGGAMPARVQRRDADILRRELKCNIVRTSHYPQSPAFLDRCDEIGLLVLEEIPGWQHIGENPWQDVAVRNVGEMVRRDWNHPSIILWGVRINESRDNHAFYSRTNQVAHSLDDTRQTGGIRYLYESELLEDVFTMNDFGFPLRPPNHPLYLNTEFNGHMFSTKRFDQVERVAEHVLRHARVHDQLASDDRYAGGIAWCAFDYNTHANFGSGDRICYHGISDIFRIPKAAAGFYKSQCDPDEEIVIEPGFSWSSGDRSTAGGVGTVPICSNCEHLKIYMNGRLQKEADPDRATYSHLKYPPFLVAIRDEPQWGDLKIEGYIGGKLVKTVTMSGTGIDAALSVEPDDRELIGDGRDATRVVLRLTDEYGNIRPMSTGAVQLTITGPGEIIGQNPFVLSGGAGAIWIKAREASGTIRLDAELPGLKPQRVEITVHPSDHEQI
ncbi:MAG TPA: glycoside hydrolase family 2 TIM barrel-domain containing protein [Bryobacteraceae bacterium]|nr:glycoside hydrolase family 2 TIM barrel-domain containing protein [Bryobacteraceae bacterium]